MAAPVTLVVLDASALLDAADARRPDLAEALRDVQARHRCVAPGLLAWELGNVVHRKHPDAFGPPERRQALVELLLEGVETRPSSRDARGRCGDLVAQTGLTFYDAAYLDLGLAGEGAARAVLVTQDRRLLAAARERGGAAYSLEEAGRAAREGRL